MHDVLLEPAPLTYTTDCASGMKVTGKKDDQVSKLLHYDALHRDMMDAVSYEEIEEKCGQRGLESSFEMIG